MMESDNKPLAFVVDDEPSVAVYCERMLKNLDYRVVIAHCGEDVFSALQIEYPDIVLLDINLPNMNGLEILEKLLNTEGFTAPVIMMTGFASVQSAVKAMKIGASDYLQKPFLNKDLERTITEHLRKPLVVDPTFPKWAKKLGLVAQSEKMKKVLRLVERLARNQVTVMLYGESGTGKELVARAIHDLGPRGEEPFIPVDCSSLASSIVESELFGHVKGSFTGAHIDREGLLRLAGKGTVLLDEIGEIPGDVQVKLLRVLQEKVIRPVGSEKFHYLECRILAASNRDLANEVQKGEFREDLFYRLNIIPINLPPLRERIEDIPELAIHFLNRHSSEAFSAKSISGEAMAILQTYNWPGNCRQLENTIQRAMILCDGAEITPADLPSHVREGDEQQAPNDDLLLNPLESAEKRAIENGLKSCDYNKRETARVLGISKTTLYTKMKKYGIH